MSKKQFCQSCGMPLDRLEVLGTEAGGSPAREYCKYCYQEGTFTTPEISLDQMETHIRTQMEKMNMPSGVINAAVDGLSYLKRWRTVNSRDTMM